MRDGIILPLIRTSGKHCHRLLTDAEYRRSQFFAARYARTPRYTEQRIRVHGWNLIVPDAASFVSMYRQIFCDQIYLFRATSPRPRIIDCGANIGLSVLYFKMLFPDAQIVAFEPDPEIFHVLRQNILANHISNVELVNKALWSHAAVLSFCREGADAGRVLSNEKAADVRVEGVPLSPYLTQSADLVKIDIEGSEVAVVRECGSWLTQASHVFIEYHSFLDRRQNLGELVNLFEERGFRWHLRVEGTVVRPFVETAVYEGMDLRLSLFFKREQPERNGDRLER
jgi:FkbM family methyltransferase